MRSVFIGSFGLRSGWRSAVYVIASTLVSLPVLITVALVWKLAKADFSQTSPQIVVIGLSLNASAFFPYFLVTWVLCRWLDKRTLSSLGLGGPITAVALSTLLGTGIGIAAIGAACLALALVGVADVTTGAISSTLPMYVVLIFFAAAWEELLFRGYAFQWIARTVGFPFATLVSSVAFAVVHGWNPNVNAVALGVILLSGLLLATARAASRDLWLPIGLHFGWNAAQGLVFGVPVSGMTGFPALFQTTVEGPELLTGGKFGFEGSISGFLSLVTAFAFLVLLARHRTPDWRMEGGSQGATSVDKGPIVG